MALGLTDSHTHLDAAEFDGDREAVIERAFSAGVTRLITIGVGGGLASAPRAIAIAEKYPQIWAAAAVHPHDAAAPVDLRQLEELARHERVVAVGETGLDFYRDWSPRDLQEKWFRAQIDLALTLNKPLIIHSREAGAQCRSILAEMRAERVGGVFHCYAEDEAFAASLLPLNFLVSFPGAVTFKKADRLREIVKAIPLDQLMVETDAPYMAPEPHRGKRCESAFVVETAKAIARVKGISIEELAAATTANALRLFRL